MNPRPENTDDITIPDSLPVEIVELIKLEMPQKISLFAQTSCFWRSHYLLTFFKQAQTVQDHETQEKYLTDLLLNHSALTREELGLEIEIDKWVDFLSLYREDKQTTIKNKLLASALLIILDKNLPQRQQDEFYIALHLYCFGNRYQKKKSFHDSLSALISSENKISLEVTQFFDPDASCITCVDEARIMLSQVKLPNLTTLAKTYEKFKDKKQTTLNYLYLIHALLKTLPGKHDFWKDWDTTFPWLIKLLPPPSTNLCNDAEINSARLDIFLTLHRHLPNLSAEESDIFDDHEVSKKINDLDSDTERLTWLAEHAPASEKELALSHVIRRTCFQLQTDESRLTAIQKSLSKPMVANTTYYDRDVIIRILIPCIQSPELRKQAIHAYLYLGCFLFRTFPLSTSFLPFFDSLSEQLMSDILTREYEVLLGNLPLHSHNPLTSRYFCSKLTSPEYITLWLTKFEAISEINSPFNVIRQEIKLCYAILLTKQPDAKKIVQLLESNYFSRWRHIGVFKILLPYIEKDIELWMDRMESPVYLHFRHEQHGDFSRYIECISILLPKLSPESQARKIEYLASLLFDKNESVSNPNELEVLWNLMRLFPDDVIHSMVKQQTTHSTPKSGPG